MYTYVFIHTYKYMYIVPCCMSNISCTGDAPCQNNGTCENAHCSCPRGYTSLYCELGAYSTYMCAYTCTYSTCMNTFVCTTLPTYSVCNGYSMVYTVASILQTADLGTRLVISLLLCKHNSNWIVFQKEYVFQSILLSF